MTIRGDLLSVDLSNVFQMLAMNRKRGVLHIQNCENLAEKRRLVLNGDRIALHEIPGRWNLCGLFVQSGIISYDEYADARTQAERFGVGAEQYLSQHGGVGDEDLRTARNRLQEELILEIFLWRHVSFSLDEEAKLPDDEERAFFSVDLVVMEAARRQDEWLRVVNMMGGGHDIWARTQAGGVTTDLSEVDRVVFDAVDGVRGTPQIMQATGLPRYHVDTAICNLSEGRCVGALTLDDLLMTGDHLSSTGHTGDAIRLFRCAVRHERQSIAIHKRLAAAYLEDQKIAKAGAHYKFCATTLLESDLPREALTIFQYVLTLLPTDFAALSRVLEIIADLPGPLTIDDRKSVDQGLKLFNFYTDSKQYEDAERILNCLLAIMPEELSLNYSLARIYSKTGRVNEAVETYMQLAGRLYEMREYNEALNVYKTVVSFDSACKEICQRKISQIREVIAQKRRRRFAAGTVVLLVVVTVALGAAYLFYHNFAGKEFERVRIDEGNIVDEAGWEAIAVQLDEVASRFPLTVAASEARTHATNARARSQALRNQRQRERDAENARHRETFERAERIYEAAWRYHTRRDFRGAVDLYEECLVLLEESGRLSWADDPSRDIRSCVARLRSMIAFEDEELKRIAGLEAEGKLAEVFATARALVDEGREQGPVGDATIRKIRIPLVLRTAPADAVAKHRDGTPMADGDVIVLGIETPRAEVTVEREGYRTRRVFFDWRKSPHEQVILLEKLPAQTVEAGDRVLDLVAWPGGVAAVGASGVVHAFDQGGRRTSSYRPEDYLTVTGRAAVVGKSILYGTASGLVRAIDLSSGHQEWVWGGTGARIVSIVSFGGRVFVATADSAELTVLDARRGKAIGVLAGGSPPTHLEVVGQRLAVFGGDESLILLDPTSSRRTAIVGAFHPGVARLGGRAFLRSRDDRLLTFGVDDRASSVTPRPIGGTVAAGPCVAAGRVVWIDSEGRLNEVGRGGAPKVRTRVVDVIGAGDLMPVGRGEVLIPGADGELVRVDVSRSEPTCAHRGPAGAGETAVRALPIGDSSWVAYGNAQGTLERY